MASMKLILLQDVEDLGLAGEEVHVAPGYARNFLIPRGLAGVASPAALRQLAAHKEKIEAKRKADTEAAQALAEKIQAAAITIPMQASDDNHLFGSVTERIIAETLAAQGIVVDVHKIHMDGQIRMLGEFTVVIRILRDISATAKINVVRA